MLTQRQIKSLHACLDALYAKKAKIYEKDFETLKKRALHG